MSRSFPGGTVVKSPPANARDAGSNPGRSPGVGNGNPLQDSCLKNSMDSGAWWTTAQRITESDTSKRREVGHNRSPYTERWSFPYILLLQSYKNRHPIYQMSGIQPGERICIFIWMNIHKQFELNWYTHMSHNLISRLEIGVKAEGNHLSSNKWIYKKNV